MGFSLHFTASLIKHTACNSCSSFSGLCNHLTLRAAGTAVEAAECWSSLGIFFLSRSTQRRKFNLFYVHVRADAPQLDRPQE